MNTNKSLQRQAQEENWTLRILSAMEQQLKCMSAPDYACVNARRELRVAIKNYQYWLKQYQKERMLNRKKEQK
jgi:hypothetical protein